MTSKAKLILGIVLLGTSMAIFGAYLKPSKAPLEKVDKTLESNAVKFCTDIMQDAKDKKAREFISKSNKSSGMGLKECFDLLQAINIPEKSAWQVRKSVSGDANYYVTLVRPGNADILFILAQEDKQWKFNYVTQM